MTDLVDDAILHAIQHTKTHKTLEFLWNLESLEMNTPIDKRLHNLRIHNTYHNKMDLVLHQKNNCIPCRLVTYQTFLV